MTMGPIPLTSVLEYGMIHDVVGDQLEEFAWTILRLDAKFIEWSNKHHAQPKRVQQAHRPAR
jgi:hypothetical protein